MIAHIVPDTPLPGTSDGVSRQVGEVCLPPRRQPCHQGRLGAVEGLLRLSPWTGPYHQARGSTR